MKFNTANNPQIKKAVLAVFIFVLLIPLLQYIISPLHEWIGNCILRVYSFIYSYNPGSAYHDYEHMQDLEKYLSMQLFNPDFYIAIYRALIDLRPKGSGGAQHAAWLYFQIYGVKSILFGALFYGIKKFVFSARSVKWWDILPVFFHGWGFAYATILLIIFRNPKTKTEHKKS